MDSISKVLSFIKDSVIFIMTELKQLERMNIFISNNILTYEVAINNLLDTIQQLNNPMYNQIVSQSTLSSILSLVNAHVSSLNKLVIRMNKWNDDVKKGGFRKFRALVRNRPSVLSQELFTKLLEIKPLLFEICTIEKETLGSGVRIKNPLLRGAWVLSGRNQVNDSSIDRTIIAENFYSLLKSELGGEVKKPDMWKRAIAKLVDEIDGCAASSNDNKISISEMNEFSSNFISHKNIKTIKALLLLFVDSKVDTESQREKEREPILALEYKPSQTEPVLALEYKPTGSEENISTITETETNAEKLPITEESETVSEHTSVDEHMIVESLPVIREETRVIPIDFTKKSLTFKSKVEIPTCSGYGSNWPSTKICEFDIPFAINDSIDFSYVEILCNVQDQGWGGTGHCNIRYRINDKPIEFGFFVDRIKFPDNSYKLVVNWEKIQPGDRIHLWLVCAPFGGWSTTINSISANAIFTYK
jgi:hypothetical protein